jgi:hypothetical protein
VVECWAPADKTEAGSLGKVALAIFMRVKMATRTRKQTADGSNMKMADGNPSRIQLPTPPRNPRRKIAPHRIAPNRIRRLERPSLRRRNVQRRKIQRLRRLRLGRKAARNKALPHLRRKYRI